MMLDGWTRIEGPLLVRPLLEGEELLDGCLGCQASTSPTGTWERTCGHSLATRVLVVLDPATSLDPRPARTTTSRPRPGELFP